MATPLPRLVIKRESDAEIPLRSRKKKKSPLALLPKYPELRPRPDPTTSNVGAKPTLSKRLPLPVPLRKPPSRRNPVSGCFISLCRTKYCRLQTHHQWDPKKFSNVKDSAMQRQTAGYGATDLLRVVDAGLDALPTLPIDLLDGREAKRLFHQFFTYDYPRQAALFSPPSAGSNTKQSIGTTMKSAVQGFLQSPVFCIQYIGSAHLHELTRRNDLNPNRISGQLRGSLLQLLREELNNFNSVDGEGIALIILTVVQFDMALNQHVALDGHRYALQHLITKLGGFHRLQWAHQYVITLDRILAICTEKPPLYAEKIDRKLLRPPELDLRYGYGLEDARDALQLGSELFDFCFDVCRAIEIAEYESWTFEPGREFGSFNVSQVHYLYFLKYYVYNTFAHLQSHSPSGSAESMSVLFAANIVAYVVLQINFLPTVTLLFLRRLTNTLKEQNLPRDWSSNENILSWILCVLVTAPVLWDGRLWAQACLTELLCSKYGVSNFPPGWIEEELKNVKQFVWSSRLDESLVKVLDQIESSRFLTTNNVKIEP